MTSTSTGTFKVHKIPALPAWIDTARTAGALQDCAPGPMFRQRYIRIDTTLIAYTIPSILPHLNGPAAPATRFERLELMPPPSLARRRQRHDILVGMPFGDQPRMLKDIEGSLECRSGYFDMRAASRDHDGN